MESTSVLRPRICLNQCTCAFGKINVHVRLGIVFPEFEQRGCPQLTFNKQHLQVCNLNIFQTEDSNTLPPIKLFPFRNVVFRSVTHVFFEYKIVFV